tara:strand:+ start:470 stop:781 length:312 start_codon:yes stop_codon:yes gene_type:complete
MSKDKINPNHYKSRSIECIEFTRELSFSLGNAFKYLWRCGMKDNEKQELEKVAWYISDFINHPRPTISNDEWQVLHGKLMSIGDEFDPVIHAQLQTILMLARV